MNEAKSSQSIAAQLRSPDPDCRIDAMLRLAGAPQPELAEDVIDALIENLSSPSKAAQRHAAGALAAAGAHNPAIAARLNALLDAPQARLRWACAYALGRIDGALDLRALAVLLEALGDADGDVRWAAHELLLALGRRHRGVLRNRLLAMCNDVNPNRRKMALYALRDLAIRDAAVIAAAGAACAGADSQVRLAALSFLKSAGRAGGQAIDVVLQRLQSDPDHGVRRAAAFTLGYLDVRSERVLSALRQAAADGRDGGLRKAARRTLGRLQEES
jgi:HEAT repeat protein